MFCSKKGFRIWYMEIISARTANTVSAGKLLGLNKICWYLDTLGIDFGDVIGVIHNIPKIYKEIE